MSMRCSTLGTRRHVSPMLNRILMIHRKGRAQKYLTIDPAIRALVATLVGTFLGGRHATQLVAVVAG